MHEEGVSALRGFGVQEGGAALVHEVGAQREAVGCMDSGVLRVQDTGLMRAWACR